MNRLGKDFEACPTHSLPSQPAVIPYTASFSSYTNMNPDPYPRRSTPTTRSQPQGKPLMRFNPVNTTRDMRPARLFFGNHKGQGVASYRPDRGLPDLALISTQGRSSSEDYVNQLTTHPRAMEFENPTPEWTPEGPGNYIMLHPNVFPHSEPAPIFIGQTPLGPLSATIVNWK